MQIFVGHVEQHLYHLPHRCSIKTFSMLMQPLNSQVVTRNILLNTYVSRGSSPRF
jgi:hypothetical protein